jgi:hypothetical protein
MKPPPHIIEIPGEVLRVLVKSRSRPKVLHLVDVEDGACSCEWHTFNVGPALARGEKPRPCWHLSEARDFILDRLLAQIAAERRRAGRGKSNAH